MFSGGLDSTVALFWAKREYDDVVALTIDYGQRHQRELAAAVKIARMAEVEHRVRNFRAFQFVSKSALTSEAPVTDAASTVTPLRNLFFLTIAACAAQENQRDIVFGACAADADAYPDCRPCFLSVAQEALALGLGLERHERPIRTPCLFLTKQDIVRLAQELPGCWKALAETWTCYEADPLRAGCGVCPSCKTRRLGFERAGLVDPLLAS